jgi:hypothetical protein
VVDGGGEDAFEDLRLFLDGAFGGGQWG